MNFYTVVYSADFNSQKGASMFSTTDLMKKFKVSKLTVTNWIRTGKVKPRKFKIGKKFYYGFSHEEVAMIAKLIKPKREWKNGQSLLRDRSTLGK